MLVGNVTLKVQVVDCIGSGSEVRPYDDALVGSRSRDLLLYPLESPRALARERESRYRVRMRTAHGHARPLPLPVPSLPF